MQADREPHAGAAATPRDTDDRAFRRYNELLRARPPHERLAQAVALSGMVRELAMAGLKERYPHAGAEELRARLAVRLYGRTLARRMFAEIPDDAT